MSVPSITDTRPYLTFRPGNEVFALDVSNVREIL
jgi:chemotaxis signal transduction protein